MAKKQRKGPEPTEVKVSGKLPVLLAGCDWDTTDIGDYRFRVMVPTAVSGITAICKGDETLAARKFARALRIDIASKLDARARLKACKNPQEVAALVQTLAQEIVNFDATSVRERAPRKPADLTGLDVSPEVLERLKAAGVKFNI